MTDPVLIELKRLARAVEQLAERESPSDLIVTRDEAARQLKISTRQLRKLVAAGRLVAQPSGIARVELERYVRTPQTPLKRFPGASTEAAEGRAMLKAMRRPRSR